MVRPPLPVRLPAPARTAPPQHAPVQVPYVPDFWHSARPAPVAPVPPKLHVVAGAATHHGGGPTHNLEKPREFGAPAPAPTPALLPDLWESLGLPRSFSPRRALAQARKEVPPAPSRPLTVDEKRGLYFLAIVGASWLLGGLVN